MTTLCDNCDRVMELEKENKELRKQLEKLDGLEVKGSRQELAEIIIRAIPENNLMELMGEPRLL